MFQQLKADMASEQVIALYDPEKETMVSSDASSFGLGAVLVQKQPSGEMRPVAYASGSMTETVPLCSNRQRGFGYYMGT